MNIKGVMNKMQIRRNRADCNYVKLTPPKNSGILSYEACGFFIDAPEVMTLMVYRKYGRIIPEGIYEFTNKEGVWVGRKPVPIELLGNGQDQFEEGTREHEAFELLLEDMLSELNT
ncbi:hypothetical protein K8R33_03065 [archaeon]|nr:hypothetical protein [archaeon]